MTSATLDKAPPTRKRAYAHGSDSPDRLSPANPGPDMPCSPARGLLLGMLERFSIPEIRAFWQAHPLVVQDRQLSELEGYRYLWKATGMMNQYYWNEVNHSMDAFLRERGIRLDDMFGPHYYRIDQGGIWTLTETITWVKNFLPKLYLDPEPMLSVEQALCGWGMQAVPGSSCQIPYLKKTKDRIETVFSFAPDGEFRFRSFFYYDPTIFSGMCVFPNYFGLPPFEEARMVADCRHPDHVLWETPWEIRNGAFLIEDERFGTVVDYSAWASAMNLKFQGTPVPDRKVILMEKDYRCRSRDSVVLREGCIYDAPLYLARISYPRLSNLSRFGNSQVYLDNVLRSISFPESDAWRKLEQKYADLLDAAGKKLIFEYRTAAQSISIDGKILMAGVPAKILWKILLANRSGQNTFDFRTPTFND